MNLGFLFFVSFALLVFQMNLVLRLQVICYMYKLVTLWHYFS